MESGRGLRRLLRPPGAPVARSRLVPVLAAPAAAAAAPRTVTLVGSLQSELGCAADWQETCAKTDLAREGDSTTYSAEFAVPAGGYELKVAIDHSWDESYGAGGA